jgi:hypothetical protein
MVNSRDHEFRWNEWNVEHLAKHGVEPWEAEHVVNFAAALTQRRLEMGSTAFGVVQRTGNYFR